jgi:hypothetical protein
MIINRVLTSRMTIMKTIKALVIGIFSCEVFLPWGKGEGLEAIQALSLGGQAGGVLQFPINIPP